MKTGLITDESGNKRWYLNDELHREDGPAIELANGNKLWYSNGKLHREDGAADYRADGTKLWYLNGKKHREDGPAQEWADGDESWFLNDKKLSQVAHAKAVKGKSVNLWFLSAVMVLFVVIGVLVCGVL